MNNTENMKVKARLPDGAIAELRLQLSWDKDRELYQIALTDSSENVTCFPATDLYQAMQALREHLETQGCQLLCAGARPDVAPSGMSRDMGGGRQAYFLQLGKQATELVDIFAYADPSVVGTVQQQRKFVDAWWASWKAQPPNRGHA